MPINSRLVRSLWPAAVAALAVASPAMAQEAVSTAEDRAVEGVVVFGRAERQIGVAMAASEGALAGADLEVRPLLRTAEILELAPGMIVTQHSGSGKANQYYLRGFNLDHGTDFGVAIDDTPMNFRTHGHGQGYLDLGGLMGEVIERVDYRKGPYRADAGDFNLVGGARITTRDAFDAPFVLAEAGDYGHRRLALGGSFAAPGGQALIAVQGKAYDGPWQLPERLRLVSTFGKYTAETPLGAFRASLSTYGAHWRPTEQIPERAIGTLIPDAFGSIDPTLKGRTERQIATVSLAGRDWRASAYVQHYDWALVSNFTFFLEDPVNGDQLEQTERLWTWGGRVERDWRVSATLSLRLGLEGRFDDIDQVGLFQTVAARRIATRSLFAVEEASAGLYGEALWRPGERLKVMAGLRGDAYGFETRALAGGAWSGKAEDAILSPKLGVAYQPADGVALYANWGQGFHSNDARGVTAPIDPAPGLVKGEGREVGLRYERGRLIATANYWWMEVESELIYVGDSGSVEPSSASERRGYELTAFWRPYDWLAVDATWTGSRARFKDAPGFDHIPGAIESSGELGVAIVREAWNAGLRVRHLGPHPLVEDNSLRSDTTTVVNLRAAWTPGRLEFYAELLNLLDSKDKDVEYVYESYLPAIDPDGPVGDLHSRVVEPRMIRAGLKLRF